MQQTLPDTAYDMLYLTACGVNRIKPELSRVEAMDLCAVHQMSRFHNLTAITCMALEDAFDGTLPEEPVFREWVEDQNKAIRKNALLDIADAQLSAFLEEQGIWHLPLKGSILKDLYPRMGMRQMSDHDILYDAAFQNQLRDWFVANGYKVEHFGTGNHDVYMKEPVLNFEMHTELFCEGQDPLWVSYYRDVRSRLMADPDKKNTLHFSDEDFYVYLTVHENKHFSAGGTGLRSLLDCYVYFNAKPALKRREIEEELEKLGLLEFEAQVSALAKEAFSDPLQFSVQSLEDESRELLDYLLSSGTYGTQGNLVANRVQKLTADGQSERMAKPRYLVSRLFPASDMMERWCRRYAPPLAKRKILLPAAYAWRLLYMGTRHFGTWKRELRTLRKL